MISKRSDDVTNSLIFNIIKLHKPYKILIRSLRNDWLSFGKNQEIIKIFNYIYIVERRIFSQDENFCDRKEWI